MTPERIAALRETLAMKNWSEATDAEMAELLTLAERYQWLRDAGITTSQHDSLSGDELDIAIDAAMKGGE